MDRTRLYSNEHRLVTIAASQNVSISERTSDSKLVVSNIISCCCFGLAKFCPAQLAALELLKYAGLL